MNQAMPRETPSRSHLLRDVLTALSEIPGICGGLIVSPDGLVIASELPAGSSVEALAALGATLGRELALGADRLGRGLVRTGLFAGDGGAILVGGTPVGFLLVLGERAIDAEAVRESFRGALERLRV